MAESLQCQCSKSHQILSLSSLKRMTLPLWIYPILMGRTSRVWRTFLLTNFFLKEWLIMRKRRGKSLIRLLVSPLFRTSSRQSIFSVNWNSKTLLCELETQNIILNDLPLLLWKSETLRQLLLSSPQAWWSAQGPRARMIPKLPAKSMQKLSII